MIRTATAGDISRLAKKKPSIKTNIEESKRDIKFSQANQTLLVNCANDWAKLAKLRNVRSRNIRYKNGDQWGDYVKDPKTRKHIREDVMISGDGKVPLKHNFIQQFTRNIHGQLLSNPTQTVVHARSDGEQNLSDMLTNTVQACHQLNDVTTLDIAMVEELLFAGIGVAKVGYQYWSDKNRFDARLDLVNTNRLFFNQDFEDVRLFDIRRIGELHDYTFNELAKNFAESKQDIETLREVYSHSDNLPEGLSSSDNLKTINFFSPTVGSNKYRVIEVWEKLGRWVLYTHDYLEGTEKVYEDLTVKQAIEQENKSRLSLAKQAGIEEDNVKLIYLEEQYEDYWTVKYLTPQGYCLKSMETPYKHETHPYVFTAMPIIDGEVTPVIADLIDIQRYINRLIVMIDFIMGSSAKGVLAVPEEAIPEGWSLEDFSDAWVRANGVILISKKAGDKLPQQITSNATNVGAWEMLKLQMDIINQVSGLSGAVQGQVARAGTPASLYAQQAQNSMLNYLLVFDRHNTFCRNRDEKLLKVVMQYYKEPRYVDINGKAVSETAKYYEPELAGKVTNFNLVMSKAMDTPIFKQIADDLLMELLRGGLIPLEVFLNNTSLPFAEKIRTELESFAEQAQQGNIDSEQLEHLQQQATDNSDTQTIQHLEQFLSSQ